MSRYLYGFNGIGLRDAQIAAVDDDSWPDVVALADGDTVFVAFNTPTAASDPEELDFGTLPPGTRSSPLTATIINVGPRPLRVAGRIPSQGRREAITASFRTSARR